MIRNYFLVALRNLVRNKSASFIKIISLSVGMICFTIISLFVYHELSYDKFHKNPERVFRIVKDFVNEDGTRLPDATTPPALAVFLQKDIPEVEHVTRVFPGWGRKYLFQYADKRFFEERVYRVDSSFFDVFTFPFVKGDAKVSFKELNSVLLTETSARKYFGNDDPMGKIMSTDVGDLMVTGILKDLPQNSHFHFDFLISIRKIGGNIDADWGFYNFYTYVRLKPQASPLAFQSKLQPLFKKYQPDNDNQYYAQALTDIHLKSKLKWELGTNGDYSYVRILSTIALFTILLAAINYVNLVTAQSARRAKEIGVRKVSGAVKSVLVKQFLIESLIMATVATVISVAVVESILPLFADLFNSTLSFFDPQNINVLLMVLGVGLATGILAGLYPAFYLSSFQPVKVLKGSLTGFGGDSFLRKGLVTFQFVISTVLIIGTVVISGQVSFIRNKKLGFSKDNILLIHNARGLSNRNALLMEIKKSSGVINAGAADGVLGGQNWTSSVRAKDHDNSLLLNFLSIDYDFLEVMGVNFLQGRNFSRNTQADSAATILNMTAVKDLGINEDEVIGSQINEGSDENPEYYTVIGVIDDFHFTSFHDPIKPFGFFLIEPRVNTLFVKINTENLTGSIAEIQNVWTKLVPDRPFEFTFQDEQVAKLYASEVKFQTLFTNFTYVAIIIACLGLFGLSAYTAQQRTKEIGIRKVLGASVFGITQLLSKEFLKLVLLGVAISIPIAWYAMHEWLQNFTYHVELSAWMFIGSSVAAIFIALLTVSFQSIKAAVADPVDSLRNE
ncbi:MAG TPA: ABC transporter permease [Cyclobacteriaceae bacterium]|nr:ABC transporter permease [Cyclobacteriaceae bacterium]